MQQKRWSGMTLGADFAASTNQKLEYVVRSNTKDTVDIDDDTSNTKLH